LAVITTSSYPSALNVHTWFPVVPYGPEKTRLPLDTVKSTLVVPAECPVGHVKVYEVSFCTQSAFSVKVNVGVLVTTLFCEVKTGPVNKLFSSYTFSVIYWFYNEPSPYRRLSSHTAIRQ
jgi:hypothetical protein